LASPHDRKHSTGTGGPGACTLPLEGWFGNAGTVQVRLPPLAPAITAKTHQLTPNNYDVVGTWTGGNGPGPTILVTQRKSQNNLLTNSK